MGKRIDIIGKKYGRLTVIEEDLSKLSRYPSGAAKHYYKCLCDCGNVTYVSKQSLIGCHVKSCGCAKIGCQMENLAGKKFNRLTVLELDKEKNGRNKERLQRGEIKNAAVNWICLCECGNYASVTSYQLKTGHTKSCGYYQSEITSQRNKDTSTKINHAEHLKDNKHDIDGDIVKVFGDKDDSFFIVDKEDYDYISNWFWRKDNKNYWVTNSKNQDIETYGKTMLRLHQIIAELKYGQEYDPSKYIPDHLNRNKSDNRKDNIELKTIAENARNRSLSKVNTTGKTGVHYSKDKGKFTANITYNYKTHYLGAFNKFEDAVEARLKAEEKYGFTCDDIIPNNATEISFKLINIK